MKKEKKTLNRVSNLVGSIAMMFITFSSVNVNAETYQPKNRDQFLKPLSVKANVSETVTKSKPQGGEMVKSSRVEKSRAKLKALFQSGKLRNLLTNNQINALVMVESGGDNSAIGDSGNAFGSLQIWQCYVVDVNQKYGTNLRDRDCLGDRNLSILIVQAYMNRYAKGKSFEQMARIHNGGPSGHTYKSTKKYWEKVQTQYKKQS